MTLYENWLKFHHYQMWNSIVDEILRKKCILNIEILKEEYLQKYNLTCQDNCFMCEYGIINREPDKTRCKKCPSILERDNIGTNCLSGIYSACCNAESFIAQAELAKIIRDSWR